MAGAVGHNGIHNVRGFLCDLCGRDCDPEAEELNALDCSYGNCPTDSAVYHQDCLEKYLRSIRLEKNRKTGFRCPRGTGKGTKFVDQPCPGKIDKSHPIHIRNDNAKKRRKAQMPSAPVQEARPKTDSKEKSRARDEETKKAKERKAKDEVPKAKAGKKVLGKEEQARQDKARLQAAAQAMRRDLGLSSEAPGTTRPPAATGRPSPSKDSQTLEEYEAARAGGGRRPAAAPANAWSMQKPSIRSPASDSTESVGTSAIRGGPPPPPPARKIPVPPASQRLSGPALKLERLEEKKSGTPVGFEAPSPPKDDAHKLTKAQRKNLRRAEKKAAERNAEKASVASSELVSDLDGTSWQGDALSEIPVIEEEGEATIFESLSDDCAHALTLAKAQSLIRQLQTLGFADWQCVPAVMAHGSNLEDAVTFLLEGGVVDERHAHELLSNESELPQIDISEELARLQEFRDEHDLDLSQLQDSVARFGGDVEAACEDALRGMQVADAQGSSHDPASASPPLWDPSPASAKGLESEFASLNLGSGPAWSEANRHSHPIVRSEEHGSQDQASRSEPSSLFSGSDYPQSNYLDAHDHFRAPEGRSVTSLARYDELVGLSPPQVPCRPYSGPNPDTHSQRDSQYLAYAPQRRASSPGGWDGTGQAAHKPYQPHQPHNGYYPRAAAPPAPAQPAATQASDEHADLDIDQLLTSLMAH